MPPNNNKTKITIFFAAALIVLIILSAVNLILLLIAGNNGKNTDAPDNQAAAIQAAAYVPSDLIPTTEIITGTISLNQENKENEEPAPEIPADLPAAASESELPGDSGEPLFAVTPSGRRYHLPACGSARNISRYLTREEAEQLGYTPCGTCRP
jgi:hypothetical protein